MHHSTTTSICTIPISSVCAITIRRCSVVFQFTLRSRLVLCRFVTLVRFRFVRRQSLVALFTFSYDYNLILQRLSEVVRKRSLFRLLVLSLRVLIILKELTATCFSNTKTKNIICIMITFNCRIMICTTCTFSSINCIMRVNRLLSFYDSSHYLTEYCFAFASYDYSSDFAKLSH